MVDRITTPGQFIRLQRRLTGQSLQRVADDAGVTPALLSRIETNQRNLTVEVACRVALALRGGDRG